MSWHPTLAQESREAGPSTTLRSAQDDIGESGAPKVLQHSVPRACPASSRRRRALPGSLYPRRGERHHRRRVAGATVVLINGGKAVSTAVSMADGSFEIMTGVEGRFFLLVSAQSFRQLETPSFYAGRLDSVERNVVLEPEWVRESIVVTATGTPTPQPQTGAATSVLGPPDLGAARRPDQRAAADAGHGRGRGRPAWRADLTLHSRR